MSGGFYAPREADAKGSKSDAEACVPSWLEDDALGADDAPDLSMHMLGNGSDVLDVLNCDLDLCKDRRLGFSYALDRVKSQRSNLPLNWDPMEGSQFMVVDIMHPGTRGPEREAECKDVLSKMFQLQIDHQNASLHEVLADIHTRTKYKVVGLQRAQNMPQLMMHRGLADAYGIKDTDVVYHGTDASEEILKYGFSLCCQRPGSDLFGKGVYCTRHAEIAILYARPMNKAREDGYTATRNDDGKAKWTQTIIRAKFKQGETRLGQKGLVLTGENSESGKEYLTMQNADGRVLVAKKEQQLYPEYEIKLEFDFESETIPTDRNFGRLHHQVWKEVQRRNAVALAPAPQGAANTQSAPQRPRKKPRVSQVIEDGTQKQAHLEFNVGEVVCVREHFKHYDFSQGELGMITRIEKQRVWMFVLEMLNPLVSKMVEKVTTKGGHSVTGVPLHQLVCKHGQIQKAGGVAGAAASAAPGT